MRHTPVLIIEDEKDGPRLRILTRCLDCDLTVSERDIDASQISLARAGDFGQLSGTEDAEAWLKHASLLRSGEQR